MVLFSVCTSENAYAHPLSHQYQRMSAIETKFQIHPSAHKCEGISASGLYYAKNKKRVHNQYVPFFYFVGNCVKRNDGKSKMLPYSYARRRSFYQKLFYRLSNIIETIPRIYPTACIFVSFSLYTSIEQRNVRVMPPADMLGNRTAFGRTAETTITR